MYLQRACHENEHNTRFLLTRYLEMPHCRHREKEKDPVNKHPYHTSSDRRFRKLQVVPRDNDVEKGLAWPWAVHSEGSDRYGEVEDGGQSSDNQPVKCEISSADC
jgi:hypothetical protein